MMSNYSRFFQTSPPLSSPSMDSHSPFTTRTMSTMNTDDSGVVFGGEKSMNYNDNNGLFGLMASSSEQGIMSNLSSAHQTINILSTRIAATTTTIDDDNTPAIEGEQNEMKMGKKKYKRAKYAFQTRSQVDILDDGYRWRKYGQKAVKNNDFPRSYYRCTHQGCNVKKQVQRLSKDEGIVVTTYEGIHSHPIEKTTDNFEHILSQMQIYPSF